MDTHVCKQCGSKFIYCRACVFRPIKYHELGFCSKACYEKSKTAALEPIEIVIEETDDTLIDDVEVDFEDEDIFDDTEDDVLEVVL